MKASFLPKQDVRVAILQRDLLTISDFDGDEPDESLIKLQGAVDFDFQPMGEHLVVACEDSWLFIDMQSDQILQKVLSANITCIKFHPDGILMATGHEDGRMNIWDIRSQMLIKTIEAPSNAKALR